VSYILKCLGQAREANMCVSVIHETCNCYSITRGPNTRIDFLSFFEHHYVQLRYCGIQRSLIQLVLVTRRMHLYVISEINYCDGAWVRSGVRYTYVMSS